MSSTYDYCFGLVTYQMRGGLYRKEVFSDDGNILRIAVPIHNRAWDQLQHHGIMDRLRNILQSLHARHEDRLTRSPITPNGGSLLDNHLHVMRGEFD